MKKRFFTCLMIFLLSAVSTWAQDSYVVAGVSTLCGSQWSPTDANNRMSSDDGVNYTLVREGCSLRGHSDYQYKVVKNGLYWYGDEFGNNMALSVEEDGVYTVRFSFNTETQTPSASATKTGNAEFEERTWTVVGYPTEVFGTQNDPENKANDMVKRTDNDYYLKKKNILLTAGTDILYKVVANHSWDEEYPVGGTYNYYHIISDGFYDLAFNFIPDSKVLFGDVDEKTFTLAGWVMNNNQVESEATQALFITQWNPEETANDMKRDDNRCVLSRTNVTLPVSTIEFKVVAAHSWAENYGLSGQGSGNVQVDVPEAGVYDVTFCFEPATESLQCTLAPRENNSVESVMSVAKRGQYRHNLQGQRVASGYRGLVIDNGRKMIVK